MCTLETGLCATTGLLFLTQVLNVLMTSFNIYAKISYSLFWWKSVHHRFFQMITISKFSNNRSNKQKQANNLNLPVITLHLPVVLCSGPQSSINLRCLLLILCKISRGLASPSNSRCLSSYKTLQISLGQYYYVVCQAV